VGKSSRSLPGVPLVRFSHSLAFIGYLRAFGAPTDRYLGTSKLPTLCEEPDNLIPVENMYTFLAAAARKEEPLLGWLVGERVGDRQLSSELRKRLEMAPSLFMALKNLMELVNSEASDIEMGIIERKDDIVVFTHYVGMRSVAGYAVAQAYQISVFVSLVQLFLGKDWRPAEIGLECQRTHDELPEQYHGSRFYPRSEFGYFTVPRSCLHRALATDGRHRRKASMGGLTPIGQVDDLELMRRLLKSYLADGYVSQAFAARLLDTSVRSLTRRLSAHGTTYQQLIDGLRLQVAKEHLGDPDMRIIDVANAVGVSDPGDFTRMFLRVSGMTPKVFRRTICHID